MLNLKLVKPAVGLKSVSYHALARTLQALGNRLEESKAIIQTLENNELSHDLIRHHSMAKVYINGAILELKKMSHVKEKETSHAFYSRKN